MEWRLGSCSTSASNCFHRKFSNRRLDIAYREPAYRCGDSRPKLPLITCQIHLEVLHLEVPRTFRTSSCTFSCTGRWKASPPGHVRSKTWGEFFYHPSAVNTPSTTGGCRELKTARASAFRGLKIARSGEKLEARPAGKTRAEATPAILVRAVRSTKPQRCVSVCICIESSRYQSRHVSESPEGPSSFRLSVHEGISNKMVGSARDSAAWLSERL